MDFKQGFQEVKESYEQMNKQASLLASIGTYVATDAAMKGAQLAGKGIDANFLRAGIELGKKGEKMHPYKETMSRNILGNKQVAPYEAGLKIGERITNRGMDAAQEERFMNRVTGMAMARKNNTRAFRDNPTLGAIENYSIGKDLKHPKIQSFLEAGSKPSEQGGRLAQLAANATTIPAAAADFRLAARPIARFLENNNTAKQVGTTIAEKAPAPTDKIKKSYDVFRNYVD